MAANGTGSKLAQISHVHSHDAKLIEQHMQRNNDLKRVVNATKDTAKSVSYSNQHSSFLVTDDKTEGRQTRKQGATEGACGGGLAKHLQAGDSEFADVRVLRTSVID